MARASQKSAEAIVVKRLVERSEERRAKEPRDNHPNPHTDKAQRLIKTPAEATAASSGGSDPRKPWWNHGETRAHRDEWKP